MTPCAKRLRTGPVALALCATLITVPAGQQPPAPLFPHRVLASRAIDNILSGFNTQLKFAEIQAIQRLSLRFTIDF